MQDALSLVAGLNGFFRDIHNLLPAQNLPVLLRKEVGLLLREEIVIVLPQQVVPGITQQILSRPVEPDEPEFLGILEEDHVRDILDNRV